MKAARITCKYIYNLDSLMDEALKAHKIEHPAPEGMEWSVTKYYDEVHIEAKPIEADKGESAS